jgi:hypothetical protein
MSLPSSLLNLRTSAALYAATERHSPYLLYQSRDRRIGRSVCEL